MNDSMNNLKRDLVHIIQDDEVQRLSVLLNRFNPFDVLKVGSYELRHTNTLAWLLDPAENHGLGDTFLRAFIARLGTPEEISKLAERFETAADHSVTVRREVWLSQLKRDRLSLTEDGQAGYILKNGAIDILIEGDGWILAIEAKLDSGEGDGQLQNYLEGLNKYASTDQHLVLVFLTIDGDEPSTEECKKEWMATNWNDNVIVPLEATLNIHQNLLPDIRSFLGSYLQTIKRQVGKGDDVEAWAAVAKRFEKPLQAIQEVLKKKAKKSPEAKDANVEAIERLLRRHAPTIRPLLAQLTSRQALRAKVIEGLLNENGFKRLGGAASYIPFVPNDWDTKYPNMNGTRYERVIFEVVNRPPHMAIKLLVPSLGEHVQDSMVQGRRKLVELIHRNPDHGNPDNRTIFSGAFNANGQPRLATGSFYSVFTDKFTIGKNMSDDEMMKAIKEKLKKIKNEVIKPLEELMNTTCLNQK